MKNIPHKIILENENTENIPLWQLIFYMFLSKDRERMRKCIEDPIYYETQAQIIDALKEHYGDATKIRFEKLKQGTISKAFKELNTPFQYKDSIYVVKKLPVASKNRTDKKRQGYQLNIIKTNTLKVIWDNERLKLISAELLEYNQICIVSPHMYVFKIKRPIARFSKNAKAQMTEKEYNATKESKENEMLRQRVKKIKQHFKAMIEAPTLFDVSATGKKIIVMLNPTPNSTKVYAPLFNSFFDNSIE